MLNYAAYIYSLLAHSLLILIELPLHHLIFRSNILSLFEHRILEEKETVSHSMCPQQGIFHAFSSCILIIIHSQEVWYNLQNSHSLLHLEIRDMHTTLYISGMSLVLKIIYYLQIETRITCNSRGKEKNKIPTTNLSQTKRTKIKLTKQAYNESFNRQGEMEEVTNTS